MHIRDTIPLEYEFFVREMTYGDHPEVEITREEFEQIQCGKKVLHASRSIEEKYDILLENYIQFEQDVALVCINEMVRGHDGYEDAYMTVRDINVRVSTLLSAARMYTDHLAADIGAFTNNEWNAPEYLANKLKEYRRDKYFRLVEGIRNYAQHVSMPISNTAIGGQWSVSEGKKHTSYHAISMVCSKQDLSRKQELARTTLTEFEDEIELKFALGKYISALGKLHNDIRRDVKIQVDKSRLNFEKWIANYAKRMTIKETPSSLTAMRVEDGAIAESVEIHLNWDDVRLKLVRRNRGIRDFSISYATTISPTVLKMEKDRKDQG